MLGYFSVVVWALVAPLLLAVYLALIGPIKDYTPDRYELSKSRHSTPTQGLATAPPSAPDTTSEAALAAQPTAQAETEEPAKVEPAAEAAPEIPAKVEPTAQAETEEPAKVEPAAEAAPEIPAKIEPTAQAETEEPAKVEPAAEAAPEIPAKIEPAARAPRAQAPSRKKQSHQQRAAQSTDPPWSRDADSFIRYIFFGRVD
jgi:outer membrane biosynthesis protein TonB